MSDSPLHAHVDPELVPSAMPASVHCLACGYSLAGLAAGGVCPECATPLERSLRGNMLEYASPRYVSTLLLGVRLVVVSLFVLGASFITVSPRSTGSAGAFLIQLLGPAAAALSLAGWWLLTTADPASRDSATDIRVRRILRALVLVSALLAPLELIQVLAGPTALAGPTVVVGPFGIAPMTPAVAAELVLAALWLLAKLASFFVGLMYLQALAVRIPDPTLYDRARRLRWVVPVVATLGLLLCGLGPLIAFGLYIGALWRCGRGLKAVRARMLATG